MSENKTYRIEEMTTVGWESIPGDYEKLSKEKAKEAMEELIREGYNPNLMRAVPDGIA
jgi:hypothetical protein